VPAVLEDFLPFLGVPFSRKIDHTSFVRCSFIPSGVLQWRLAFLSPGLDFLKHLSPIAFSVPYFFGFDAGTRFFCPPGLLPSCTRCLYSFPSNGMISPAYRFSPMSCSFPRLCCLTAFLASDGLWSQEDPRNRFFFSLFFLRCAPLRTFF